MVVSAFAIHRARMATAQARGNVIGGIVVGGAGSR